VTVGDASRKTESQIPHVTVYRKHALLLGSLLLLIATLGLYYPVGGHPFVNYDDSLYVTQNLQVRSGLNWDTVGWSFRTFDVGMWHPLTWLSHALDCQLFQLNPRGHHDVNLLLHAANVVLLFWVLLRATGYAGRSFMVAALFALHPINVESVAWVAERKTSLSMLFFLLALGAYRWYASNPRAVRYVVVAVLYALGLLAKAQVITLPCVLLLWDYWPLRRMWADDPRASAGTATTENIPSRTVGGLVLEKLPLFVLAAAAASVTMVAQRAIADKGWFSLSVRLENAAVSYVRYVSKALWPARLAVFYPHPGNSIKLWEAGAAALFLLVITLLVTEKGRPRYLPVGWLWFVGTMVPMIGLEGVGYLGRQGMADRYAYLPLIGLFLMICWGVAEWAARRRISVMWLAGASAGVLLALSVVAHRQIGYWGDNVSLWSHAAEVTNGNFLAENNLGRVLMSQGKVEEGIAHFEKAVAIYPDDPVSNLNLGTYEEQRGNLTEAVEHFQKAVKGRDLALRATAAERLGKTYLDLGEPLEAQQYFGVAVQFMPADYEAWINLGTTAQKNGDLVLAVKAYSRAEEIQPSDVGYVLLAKALEQSGRKDDAHETMEHARRISPDFEEAQREAERVLGK
jgi:hypothetical protein